MKHSLETKLKAINYVLSGNGGERVAAKKFGVHHTCLHQWLAIYQLHGAEGLTKKLGSYSGKFKFSVIQSIINDKLSYRAAAAYFNIPAVSTVRKWVKLYQEEGYDILFLDQRGRSNAKKNKPISADKFEPLDNLSPEEMVAELRYLRAENDYLKKLEALVQEKKNFAQKKKQK